VLVTGIPFISPYNVHAFLNPLLVQVLAQGYLFNMYRGAPLVKKGGTLIITHPCTDKFDHEQHAPYIDFVHRLLPETRNSDELRERYEEKFAKDPALVGLGGEPVARVGEGGGLGLDHEHRRRAGPRHRAAQEVGVADLVEPDLDAAGAA